MQKIYFTTLPNDSSQFIAIRHGESGYYESTVYDQNHADMLNAKQGITAAEVEAAEMASIFDQWERFDYFISTFCDS